MTKNGKIALILIIAAVLICLLIFTGMLDGILGKQ